MKIILVRHTETHANKEGMYGGVKDYGLSSKGFNDMNIVANEVCNKYKNEFKDKITIWTSPLSRCTKLANNISNKIQGNIKFDKRLIELDFGIFDGLTNKEIMTTYNIEYNKWINDFKNYIIPNGESLYQCHRRVKEFIKEILKEDKDVVIVTHGGIIKLIIIELLNLSLDDYWKFYCGNGAIVELSYYDGFGYIKNLIHAV